MGWRDPTNEDRRRSLPILVFVIGLLLTAAAWQAVRDHERSQVHWATDLVARTIQRHLVTDMEWQIVGLDRLAMLWEAADPAQDLWTKNADLYMEHRPGCIAVAWLTPNGEARALVTAPGKPRPLAFGGSPQSLLADAATANAAMISAPEPVPDGSRQWAVAYPVKHAGQPRGFVVSFFDFQKTLNHLLSDIVALDFSFGVLPPRQADYLVLGTSGEHEQQWETLVDVPVAGTTWKLKVWPNANVVDELQSLLPGLTLGVGSVFSLLLALSLYFGGAAALSSRRASQANEALQREIGVRQGAQEELRRAHAELETRIEQRTGELAGSNALLQKEVAERQRAQESLQALTGRLFHLQDEERRRLARELHDGAVQNLVALAMDMGMVGDAIPAGDIGTKELVHECVRLIEQSTKELRTISYLLHPPYFDELGLPAALRDFSEGFAARSGIRITLEIDPDLGRLGHEVELTIFRVVQEALSNVHRHSRSATAKVSIARRDGFLRFEVADAGRGIPAEILDTSRVRLTGVGIAGMRERVRLLGGRLDIQSGNGGTSICAVLPLPSADSTTRYAVAGGAPTIGDAPAGAGPNQGTGNFRSRNPEFP